MNPYRDVLDPPLTPAHESPTQEMSLVAAQLIEAAWRARDGDREATTVHIAHAVALLGGNLSSPSRGAQVTPHVKTHPRGGLPAWQVSKVVAYVEANLSDRILVRELARVLGLHASHFCRAFKRTFGAPPRDYLLRRRIEVAQGLMLTTSEPLSSIAIRCGMCDQPHFTHAFRRVVGETPYVWRRARRGTLNAKRFG